MVPSLPSRPGWRADAAGGVCVQKLHLVGFTADRKGLIFSPRRGSKGGTFIVAMSDDVLQAIDALRNGDEVMPVPEQEVSAQRQESSLSVREVQARLRVGRSIAEVARAAGVDQEWVERFAVPVLAEQRRVIDEAQRVHVEKRGSGQSALPLGEAVRLNATSRGLVVTDDEFADAWSAYQLHDNRWVVRFRYRSRGRDQEARWEYDQVAGSLASQERLGTALGYVAPGEELAPAPPTRRPPARRRAAASAARRRTPVSKTVSTRGRKRGASKKAPRKRSATGAKAAAAEATAAKKAAKKAAPKKKAPKKATPKKAAPKKAARKKAPPKKATPRKAASKKRAPAARENLPPPARATSSPTRAAAKAPAAKKARAKTPPPQPRSARVAAKKAVRPVARPEPATQSTKPPAKKVTAPDAPKPPRKRRQRPPTSPAVQVPAEVSRTKNGTGNGHRPPVRLRAL